MKVPLEGAPSNSLLDTSGQANRRIVSPTLRGVGRKGTGKSYGNVNGPGAMHPGFFGIAVFLMGRAA